MPEVIKNGYVYLAMPPLYKVIQNKVTSFFYTEEEKETFLKGKEGKMNVQRYKGLGEMNPEQLWETTMNPENRTLLLVTTEDATEADRTFDMLMGDEVAPRKKFITTHAKKVRNLDI
jgi:DNA gyrase subunit B